MNMNIKKNFLFFIISLLMTFLSPNYATAFTFSALDTQGRLLNFSDPVLIAGTAVAAGAGTASVGAKFKYTNVITVNGTQVDAIVSVDNIVNMTITKFDEPKPNPTPKNPAQRTLTGTTVNYVTSFGGVVPEGAIFAPQLTAVSHTADAHVDFTISFQDTSGKAVVLQNVYNNSLDDENVEYNEFGGFVSYVFASDYKTNLVQHMVAGAGLNGKIRFSNSNCAGNAGLYITDSSRVQTRFNTVTSLKLTLGQFANGTAPTGIGSAVSTCANTGVRFYGAVFVKDGFKESGVAPFETIAPTVNLLTTSDTKPTITGSLGGIVTATSATGIQTGSPLAVGETFSVTVNGVVYSNGNANLVMTGANWSLTIPTVLPVLTYEVSATRTGGLVDQSNNELTITPVCNVPQVLNLSLTACVSPLPSDVVLCHTGDIGDRNGDGVENSLDNSLRHYVKAIINPTGTTGHETHPNDVESTIGAAGRECPDDVPICSSTQILDAATKTCITAVRPTVNTAAASTLLAPALSGTVGTSSSITVTVKNAADSTTAASGTATISGTSWTYAPAILPIGIYDVVVTTNTGLTDATTNELTVTLACSASQIFNAQGTACITPSVPTINSTTTNDKIAASLSGTLGTSTSLTITVNGVSGAATVNLSAGTWSYTPAILPNGTYNVIATGNTGLVDTTTNELVVSATTVPTVTPITFNDKQIPTITGTTGTSTAITVSVNGVSGAATVTGSTWSYTLPTALAANTYPVTATGNIAGLIGTGTLTVTATVAPTVNTATSTTAVAPALSGTVGTSTSLTVTVNGLSGAATINSVAGTWTYTPAVITTAGTYNVVVTGDSAHGSLVDTSLNELTVTQAAVNPTVDPNQKATTTATQTITGTFGTSTTLTITAKNSVTNVIYPINTATKSGVATTWSVTTPNKLPAGTYDVIVTGETGLVDGTSNELVVSETVVPTVDAVSTTTSVAPTLTGTLGSSTSLIITVKNSAGATMATSSTITPSGTTWSYTPAILTTAGTYNVTATGDSAHGNLVDISINELTVSIATTVPTVDAGKTATDITKPTLTGNVGTSASVTIAINDSTTGATYATSSGSINYNGNSSNKTWSFQLNNPIPAGTYNVVATGDTGLVDTTTEELVVSGSQTGKACTVVTYPLPSPLPTGNAYLAQDTSSSSSCSGGNKQSIKICRFSNGVQDTAVAVRTKCLADGSYTPNGFDTIWVSQDSNCPATAVTCKTKPTVTAKSIDDQTVVTLNGTADSDATSMTIVIKDSNGNTQSISGTATSKSSGSTTWTFTSTTKLPVGVYSVTATDSYGVVDQTINELTVTKFCASPATVNAAGTACESLPTIDPNQTATDTVAPTITGTFGTSTSVTITAKHSTTNVTYAIGTATKSGSATTWSVTRSPATAIPSGMYDVIATGTSGTGSNTVTLVDNTTGELSVSAKPTVDYPKTFTDKQIPTLTGTAGTSTSLTITIKTPPPIVSGTITPAADGKWSYTPSAVIAVAGIYDVEAKGNTGLVDITTQELTVTQSAVNPTIVCPATVTDAGIPTITGTFGTGSPLTITVKDSSGVQKATGTKTNSGTTTTTAWSFDSVVLPIAGTYTATATGVPTTLTASCTFPVTQTPIAPTVLAATTTDLAPAHLSGTLGTSTSITGVTIGSTGISCPVVIDLAAKTWTCTTSAAIATAGNYTVTATGVSGSGTGTLTVTASAVPTVNTKTTLDKIAPALSGNAGASTSLTITIKSTPEVTGAATITGSTWTFTPSTPIAAGTYDVVALGNSGLVDATPNELTVTTCTIPEVYNAAGDACITPVPTVMSLNTNSSTPIITGTVGVVALGATESFSVLVNNKTYTKSAVATNPLVVNALNWTLTIPATDVIPAGTHEVEATRNTSKDITHNELVVNLVCTTPEIINSAHTACITPAVPTVNIATTTDKIAAALSGNVGTSTSLVINVNDATGATQATGNAIITGTTWTFAPSVLPAGIYNVVATGDTGLIDATTSELKVTATCSLPKVANAAGTVCVYPTPTVNPIATLTKAQQPITLSGSIGGTTLGGSESFTVTVGGVTYTQSTIVVSGTTWSLQLPILNAGTYDVDVSRSGVLDETSKELVITDKIDICNGGTDQSIERSAWVDWQHDENYYLGKCHAPVCHDPKIPADAADCTAPLPKNPVQACQDSLNPANDPLCPRIPDALVEEAVTLPLPPEVTYCYDDTGAVTGVKSDASVTTSVTIKRARIANASTQDGTFDNSTLVNTVVKYGTKQQGALVIEPYTDSNGAPITPVITKGKVVGAKITGAVIAGAYIDIPNDYIDDKTQNTKLSCLEANGSLKLSCFIKVTGGITNPTSIKEGSATPVPATITNGMITSGTDSDGNPVRGSVTSGQFDKPITNSDTTITQGRRVKGQLMNAIIENATTTTVSGVTVVSAGNVISGEMDPETTATTFGTVTNATISGVKISSTNHCFSSGTVGSRGQLNWKEVVK